MLKLHCYELYASMKNEVEQRGKAILVNLFADGWTVLLFTVDNQVISPNFASVFLTQKQVTNW
jgi:hypothetical protein